MAAHVGKETTFEAQGETWTSSRWERGSCHDEFVAWAKSKLPDPRVTAVEEVEFLVMRAATIMADPNKTPVEKQLLIQGNLRQQEFVCQYSIDVQNQYLAIDSEPVRKIMATDEGSLKMLQIMLKARHGDVPAEKCLAILEELGARGIQAIFDKSAGVSPPKAPAPSRGDPSPSPEPLLPGETSTKSLSVATPG